jgi:hypothetical protein
MGFDSISGKTRGICVQSLAQPARNPGSKVTRSVFYASSLEVMDRELGLSGGVNFGVFGIGVNLGLENVERQSDSHSRSYAVVEIVWESATTSLADYRLTPDTYRTLKKEGERAFYEVCGDGFVVAERSGGHFLGVIALTGVTQEETNSLSGSAGVSFLGIGATAGASTETRDFLERHQAMYYVAQRGGNVVGPSSARQLESIDVLLRAAVEFERGLDSGKDVATGIVVRPYQVVSNRPPGVDFLDLREQRHFLDRLYAQHGALLRAKAEAADRVASGCGGESRALQQLVADYSARLEEIELRGSDCINNPSRRCTDRGLEPLEERAHQRALTRCTPARAPTRTRPAQAKRSPEPEKRCNLWEVTEITTRVAKRKVSGEPWDGEGSAPDLTLSVWRGNERLVSFGARATFSRTDRFESPVYLHPGERLAVRMVDADAMFDDPIGTATIEVSSTRSADAWRGVSGAATVTLAATCARTEAVVP